MSQFVEKLLALVWTVGLAVLWVVVVAAVLLPLMLAADWWLGSSVELLAHPRRNAVIVAVVLLVAACVQTFRPATPSASDQRRSWWRGQQQ